jgi:hypothetical protein
VKTSFFRINFVYGTGCTTHMCKSVQTHGPWNLDLDYMCTCGTHIHVVYMSYIYYYFYSEGTGHCIFFKYTVVSDSYLAGTRNSLLVFYYYLPLLFLLEHRLSSKSIKQCLTKLLHQTTVLAFHDCVTRIHGFVTERR